MGRRILGWRKVGQEFIGVNDGLVFALFPPIKAQRLTTVCIQRANEL